MAPKKPVATPDVNAKLKAAQEAAAKAEKLRLEAERLMKEAAAAAAAAEAEALNNDSEGEEEDNEPASLSMSKSALKNRRRKQRKAAEVEEAEAAAKKDAELTEQAKKELETLFDVSKDIAVKNRNLELLELTERLDTLFAELETTNDGKALAARFRKFVEDATEVRNLHQGSAKKSNVSDPVVVYKNLQEAKKQKQDAATIAWIESDLEKSYHWHLYTKYQKAVAALAKKAEEEGVERALSRHEDLRSQQKESELRERYVSKISKNAQIDSAAVGKVTNVGLKQFEVSTNMCHILTGIEPACANFRKSVETSYLVLIEKNRQQGSKETAFQLLGPVEKLEEAARFILNKDVSEMIVEVFNPQAMGSVKGKGGENLRKVETDNNVIVVVSGVPGTLEKVRIFGARGEAQAAMDFLKSQAESGVPTVINVKLPDPLKARILTHKGGAVIKQLEKQTDCRIHILRDGNEEGGAATKDGQEVAQIKGRADIVESARKTLLQFLNDKVFVVKVPVTEKQLKVMNAKREDKLPIPEGCLSTARRDFALFRESCPCMVVPVLNGANSSIQLISEKKEEVDQNREKLVELVEKSLALVTHLVFARDVFRTAFSASKIQALEEELVSKGKKYKGASVAITNVRTIDYKTSSALVVVKIATSCDELMVAALKSIKETVSKVVVKVLENVPSAVIRRLLGKQAAFLQELESSSGCSVSIVRKGESMILPTTVVDENFAKNDDASNKCGDNEAIRVCGANAAAVEKLLEKLRQLKTQVESMVTVQIAIEPTLVGTIIGAKGATVKKIQDLCHKIDVSENKVVIQGSAEECQRASAMVEKIIAEEKNRQESRKKKEADDAAANDEDYDDENDQNEEVETTNNNVVHNHHHVGEAYPSVIGGNRKAAEPSFWGPADRQPQAATHQ